LDGFDFLEVAWAVKKRGQRRNDLKRGEGRGS